MKPTIPLPAILIIVFTIPLSAFWLDDMSFVAAAHAQTVEVVEEEIIVEEEFIIEDASGKRGQGTEGDILVEEEYIVEEEIIVEEYIEGDTAGGMEIEEEYIEEEYIEEEYIEEGF